MPSEEFKETVKVDKDHRIVLTFPQLEAGTEVQIRGEIEPVQPSGYPRKAGSAKGQIVIRPSFDDPLEEFEDYR